MFTVKGGTLKGKVYSNSTGTADDLKEAIQYIVLSVSSAEFRRLMTYVLSDVTRVCLKKEILPPLHLNRVGKNIMYKKTFLSFKIRPLHCLKIWEHINKWQGVISQKNGYFIQASVNQCIVVRH
jgi:hypothetical protein